MGSLGRGAHCVYPRKFPRPFLDSSAWWMEAGVGCPAPWFRDSLIHCRQEEQDGYMPEGPLNSCLKDTGMLCGLCWGPWKSAAFWGHVPYARCGPVWLSDRVSKGFELVSGWPRCCRSHLRVTAVTGRTECQGDLDYKPSDCSSWKLTADRIPEALKQISTLNLFIKKV